MINTYQILYKCQTLSLISTFTGEKIAHRTASAIRVSNITLTKMVTKSDQSKTFSKIEKKLKPMKKDGKTSVHSSAGVETVKQENLL